mgnify:CR=1 FL=1
MARLCQAACFSASREGSGSPQDAEGSKGIAEADKMPKSGIPGTGIAFGSSDDGFGFAWKTYLFGFLNLYL